MQEISQAYLPLQATSYICTSAMLYLWCIHIRATSKNIGIDSVKIEAKHPRIGAADEPRRWSGAQPGGSEDGTSAG